jgi:hypothetical protein
MGTYLAGSILLLGCSADDTAPATAQPVDDAAVPEPAIDASAPAVPQALPYPAGPYGGGVGDVMPDLHLAGYALSRSQTDSSQLPFREITLAEVRSDPACTCMVVTLTANGTQCFASIAHDHLLTNLITKRRSLCAIEVSFFNHDGIGTTLLPWEQPSTRADLDAFTRSGRENFPVGIPQPDARRALSAYVIGAVPASFIVRPSDMRILGVNIGTGINFEGVLDDVCAHPEPPVEYLARGLALRRLAVDGSYVYASDDVRGVIRIPAAGGAPETLALPDQPAEAVEVDATHVYWASRAGSTNVIGRVAKAGGTPETLATSTSVFTSMRVHDGNVYFTRKDGLIGFFPVAGGAPATLATGENDPTELLVDDTHVYWIASGTGEVGRVAKESGVREVFVAAGALATSTGSLQPTLLSWYRTGLVVGAASTFFWVPKTGDLPKLMQDVNAYGLTSVAVQPDTNHIVFSAQDAFDGAGLISDYAVRSSKALSATVPVTPGQDRPNALVGDGTYLYWTVSDGNAKAGAGELRRKKLP